MKKSDIFNKLKKDKRVLAVIGIGILGMLLLLMSETKASEKNVKDNDAMPYGTEAEKALERRLENLLSEVGGVGRVKVMVTLDGTWESIYAKDSETKDGSEKEEYVTVKENGKNTGLKIRSVRPDIKGVGVSCEGADSASVRLAVTNAISVLTALPSDRISVVRGKP